MQDLLHGSDGVDNERRRPLIEQAVAARNDGRSEDGDRRRRVVVGRLARTVGRNRPKHRVGLNIFYIIPQTACTNKLLSMVLTGLFAYIVKKREKDYRMM